MPSKEPGVSSLLQKKTQQSWWTLRFLQALYVWVFYEQTLQDVADFFFFLNYSFFPTDVMISFSSTASLTFYMAFSPFHEQTGSLDDSTRN